MASFDFYPFQLHFYWKVIRTYFQLFFLVLTACVSFSGKIDDIHVPLVYALACNKKQETYELILSVLLNKQKSIDPQHAMVDFEKGAMNAIDIHFPHCQVHGCYFHFTQCFWRKIQEFGLVVPYIGAGNNENGDGDDDTMFAYNLKLLLALAFVPEVHVIKAYTAIINMDFFQYNEEKEFNTEIDELLTYFESTWIGSPLPRSQDKRKKPRFAINIWNMYGPTLQGLSRTNNAIEGWHNAISPVFGTHPSIFKFIEKMKNEQSVTELKIHQSRAGRDNDAPRKLTYKNVDANLEKIVHNLNLDMESDAEDSFPIEEKLILYLKSIVNTIRLCKQKN